jgi:hypothetical protein
VSNINETASQKYRLPTNCKGLDTYLMNESVLVYSKKTQQVRGYEKGKAALYLQIEALLQTHARKDILEIFSHVDSDLLSEMIALAGCKESTEILEYQTTIKMGQFVAGNSARTMYVVEDLGFAIHYPDEELFASLHPLLEHLNVQHNDLKMRVSIDLIRSGTSWKIKWNDTITEVVIPQVRLAGYLQDMMMTAAFQSHPLLIKLHAASVEKKGRVVVMPAVAGSGKSTLTASMLRHGFKLFSDEATSMDKNGYVQPLPFSLNIKEGSWDVLAPIYPHLENLDVHSRFDGQNIRFLPPEPMHEGRQKASHIVFPRYTPGSRTLLTPLGTTPALLKIKEAGYYVQDNMDDKKFALIIDNLLSLPKYSLVYSDLDEAITMIDDLIASDTVEANDGS